MVNFELLRIFLIISSSLSGICFVVCMIIKMRKPPIYIYRTNIRLETGFLIASYAFAWYTVSIGLTIYNKWIMEEFRNGFRFPIFNTTIHMLVKLIISRIWYCFSPSDIIINKVESRFLVFSVALIGICTSGDIALSNEAMLNLNITLYTALKTSVLLFTYFWSLFIGVEAYSFQILIAVSCIAIGIGLAVFSITNVSFTGVFYSTMSSNLAGLRWTLLQYLVLYDIQSSHNPMVALYRFSPYSFLSIVPVAILLEGKSIITSPTFSSNFSDFIQVVSLVTLGGFISLVLIILEVRLVQHTSSLTLGVIGQVKEALQITLSIFIYQNNINTKSIIGIIISLLAAQYYQCLQISRKPSFDHKIPSFHNSNRMNVMMGPRNIYNAKNSKNSNMNGSNNGTLFRKQFRINHRTGNKNSSWSSAQNILSRFHLFTIFEGPEDNEHDGDNEQDHYDEDDIEDEEINIDMDSDTLESKKLLSSAERQNNLSGNNRSNTIDSLEHEREDVYNIYKTTKFDESNEISEQSGSLLHPNHNRSDDIISGSNGDESGFPSALNVLYTQS